MYKAFIRCKVGGFDGTFCWLSVAFETRNCCEHPFYHHLWLRFVFVTADEQSIFLYLPSDFLNQLMTLKDYKPLLSEKAKSQDINGIGGYSAQISNPSTLGGPKLKCRGTWIQNSILKTLCIIKSFYTPHIF
jgi:hypothetical protein